IGAQQALVRVLSVDVDQLVAQFVAGVDVAFGEPGLLRVAGIEHRADVRPSGAFAQHAGVGPPGTRSRASISMGLPASVLPENTVKPGLKAISASSTMTMSRMCRARSMGSLGSVAGLLRQAVSVELARQGGKEAVAQRMQEPDGVGRAAHFDAVSGLQVGPGFACRNARGRRGRPGPSP